jgi:hypothetical protein
MADGRWRLRPCCTVCKQGVEGDVGQQGDVGQPPSDVEAGQRFLAASGSLPPPLGAGHGIGAAASRGAPAHPALVAGQALAHSDHPTHPTRHDSTIPALPAEAVEGQIKAAHTPT